MTTLTIWCLAAVATAPLACTNRNEATRVKKAAGSPVADYQEGARPGVATNGNTSETNRAAAIDTPSINKDNMAATDDTVMVPVATDDTAERVPEPGFGAGGFDAGGFGAEGRRGESLVESEGAVFAPTFDPMAAGNDSPQLPGPSESFARARLEPKSDSKVTGLVDFMTVGDKIAVAVSISGAKPGLHGFHVHEKGDCAAPDAKSAGEHFNPTGDEHGGPNAQEHHVGDLGNIAVDPSGKGRLTVIIGGKDAKGGDVAKTLVGKSVLVHEKEDDLKTQPSGGSGARIACGVIEKVTATTAH